MSRSTKGKHGVKGTEAESYRVLDKLKDASDVYCALRCHAVVEHMVFAILSDYLADTRCIKGQLNNAASIACGVGLIPDDARHHIEVISNIRNEFAHNLDDITFEDLSLDCFFHQLWSGTNQESRREQYIATCALLINGMSTCMHGKTRLRSCIPWHPKSNVPAASQPKKKRKVVMDRKKLPKQ